MKKIILLILCMGALFHSYAQNDCEDAITLCSNTGEAALDNGEGTEECVSGNCSCFTGGENNSIWYQMTVSSDGVLYFDITPTGSADYDWAVWNTGPGGSCTDVTSANEVSCNWDSGAGEQTGLSSSGNGPPGCGCDADYEIGPSVTTGDVIYIMIDNHTDGSTVGFDIDFYNNDGDDASASFACDAVNTCTTCNDADCNIFLYNDDTDPVTNFTDATSDGACTSPSDPNATTMTVCGEFTVPTGFIGAGVTLPLVGSVVATDPDLPADCFVDVTSTLWAADCSGTLTATAGIYPVVANTSYRYCTTISLQAGVPSSCRIDRVCLAPELVTAPACLADHGSAAPTVTQSGDGTNTNVLCFGTDQVAITSPGDEVMPPAANSEPTDLGYAIYACAPTTNDPDTDPCWTGYYFAGDFTSVNNVNNVYDFIIANPDAGAGANGVPSERDLYFAAITMDDDCTTADGCGDDNLGHDVNEDGCFSMDFNEAFQVTYLEAVSSTVGLLNCGAGTATITLSGGYPGISGSGASYVATNTGSGTLSQSGTSGETITISGLSGGDAVSFNVASDGNGCTETITVTSDFCPPGEGCASAISIDCDTPLTGQNTADGLDSGDHGSCDGGIGLWYEFTSDAAGGNIAVAASNATFDHEIMVLNACDLVTALALESCQDGTAGALETATFDAAPNTTYYIHVRHFSNTSITTGTFDLAISGAGCPCLADHGSVPPTVAQSGDGTNTNVLCFGTDEVAITSPGDEVMPPAANGEPTDLGYAIYACAPTTNDPDTDPCWTGYYYAGDVTSVNNVNNVYDFIIANPDAGAGASGVPSGRDLYFAAITMDDDCTTANGCGDDNLGHDVNNDGCFSMDFNEAFQVTYLEEVATTEVFDCGAGTVTVTLSGGYPEVPGSGVTYVATNTGAGSLTQSGTNNETITVSGLSSGDVVTFTILDGNGCPASYSYTAVCAYNLGGGTAGGGTANGCEGAINPIDYIFANSGLFRDPEGTGDYANNYNNSGSPTGTTVICPEPGTEENISMTFNSFGTESGWDELYVFDGPSAAYPPASGSPFSGSTLPGTITASSSTGCLTFLFYSDGNTVDIGFEATWTTTGSNAAEPAGNQCADAITILGNVPTAGDNIGHTATCDEDPFESDGCAGSQENSIWYKFASDADGGPITAQLTNVNTTPAGEGDAGFAEGEGGVQFTIMSAGAVPGDCNALTYEACSGNTGPGTGMPSNGAAETFNAAANTCYYLRIDGFAGDEAEWMLEIIGEGVLPVSLIDFTGRPMETTNKLEWKTASEENTEWHVIERSLDGKDNWSEVGRLKAAGTTSEVQQYELLDRAPIAKAYYRLRSVDFDDKEDISKIIQIERRDGAGTINAYPNPVSGLLHVNFEMDSKESVILKLTDVSGRTIHNYNLNVERGANTHDINFSTLPCGVYFLQVESSYGLMTQRIVKTQY